MDPYTTSLEQAGSFMNEILDLPEHEAMREHYR